MINDEIISQAEELVRELRQAQRDESKCKAKIRKSAWEEYQKRNHYTDDQHATFMAGMCVMWRLMGGKQPLFTYGPDSWPKEVPRQNDESREWQLGDLVQIPHFEGGLTQPAQIKEFRGDRDSRYTSYVRVENPEIQLTAWWPIDKLVAYQVPAPHPGWSNQDAEMLPKKQDIQGKWVGCTCFHAPEQHLPDGCGVLGCKCEKTQ